MSARIVREATGTVLSDKMHFFDGWFPDYPDPTATKTVNNVTVFQRRGRMEWIAKVTFVFCDDFPGAESSVARMFTLLRSARRNEWFKFRDRRGEVYRVRVKGVPQPERDEDRSTEYYYLDLDLLLEGYE